MAELQKRQERKWSSRHALGFLVVCLAGILINLGFSTFSGKLGLPFYLDSIGTILVTLIGGAIPGVVVGLFTNFIKAVSDFPSIYYGSINVMIAVVTALFARQGLKKRHVIPLIISLGFIGGVLGGIMTWFLFGFATEGISAEFAKSIHCMIPSRFLSQIMADFAFDIADKAISVVAAYLIAFLVPETIRKLLHIDGWRQNPLNSKELKEINRTQVRQISLRSKLIILVSVAMTIIAVVAISIGYVLYREETIDDHSEFGQGIARYERDAIDPEMVDSFLELGEDAPGYKETEERLRHTLDTSTNIKFMYVYQIREDGCHVVFDLDTEDVTGAEAGELIPFEEDFEKYKDELLAGKPIDPTINNGMYGWLLTAYEPIYNHNGECVCYAGVDISMNTLQNDMYTYLAKQISLFLGVYIVVLCLVVWLADFQIIYPLNSMSYGASAFAYTSTAERNASVERIKALGIRTGDEIENLYRAYSQTTEESMQYLTDIRKKSRQIDKMQGGLLMVLADIIESRDQCTGDHIRKTAAYTEIILKRLQEKGAFPDILSKEYIANVGRAAPLHDIGKINVPDAILNKPGKLTDEEYEIMKGHAQAGYEIIEKAIANMDDIGYLQEAKEMAHYHHEKWDGTGYPSKLKGEEIPLSARVMAVADVFDALTSRRSYKAPFTLEKAMSIISEGAGKHFDPQVVEAFNESAEKVQEVLDKFSDENDPAQPDAKDEKADQMK